jgi:16S rRNA (cytosine967-C5)-methyltransferase
MAVDLPREIALKILYDINQKGAYSNIAVNKYLECSELQKIDKAFITELVYGTLRRRLTIDWIIGQFSTLKRNRISDWVLNILRMGIYQLIYMEKVPQSAACNESVKLSKKYGHKASSGYVNAVLRNVARNRDKIAYPDKHKEYIRFLSIKHSHPQWLVEKWVRIFGGEFTEKLLAGNNETADFIVRVNTLKISRKKLIEELRIEGIDAVEGKYAEEAVILKNPSSISRLESFRKGYFQVQDESSMLAVKVLAPQPGEFIMDVCSAPGGKASHIAQVMGNRGTVLARDIHEHKIGLVKGTVDRMGLNIVRTEIFDAAVSDSNYIMKADRVLVDAPCTGLGIIRRKPEIKWSRNMENINEIIELQAKILNTSSNYVKPGGVLVYSTCTINPEENEEVVREFISMNTAFKTEDISCMLPENIIKPKASSGYIQMLPNVHGTDGFFIARMRRMES